MSARLLNCGPADADARRPGQDEAANTKSRSRSPGLASGEYMLELAARSSAGQVTERLGFRVTTLEARGSRLKA